MITRRRLLGGCVLAGLAGLRPRSAAAEPPPETTALRVGQFGSLCVAPQYVAEELLRAEGFTEIQYPMTTGGELNREAMAGRIHLTMGFVGPTIVDIDAGAPLVFLAGVHPGCYEVFGTDRIRTMRDFKGKTLVVTAEGGGQKLFSRPCSPTWDWTRARRAVGGASARRGHGAPRQREGGRLSRASRRIRRSCARAGSVTWW